jgi:ribosomal protein S18 acetylase RimI-like enzyme
MYTIRKAEYRDRTAILETAMDVGVFTNDEVACVDELLDTFLHQEDDQDYTFILCCGDHAQLLGFACYGPHPLTDGTYDLYWLCVSTSVQGNGVAAELLSHVEEDLSKRNARLLVAETSGTSPYAAARAFYEHRGFQRWT